MLSRKWSLRLAMAPVMSLVAGLLWAIMTGRPMYLALAIGALAAFVTAFWFLPLSQESAFQGESSYALLKQIVGFSRSGVSKVINVVLIVIIVNVLTAVWFASGTVQSLVYYGLKVINPRHVLLAGYILTTLVSMVLGSSVGTLSTVGIAIMGMARSLGIPLGPSAGVLVSGALLGDRTSPVSPIFHLTYTMAQSDQNRTFKKLMQTGLSAWAATFALYAFMEPRWTQVLAQGEGSGLTFISRLPESLNINYWLVLPPALVLLLAAIKVPVKRCLAVGLVTGLVLAHIFQGETVGSLMKYMISGFVSQKYPSDLAQIMKGGGLVAAKNVMLLLFFAGIFSGIMEESGMIKALAEPLLRNLTSRESILVGALGLSCFSAAVASNQVLAIIIPATLLRDKARENGVEPEDLARVLSDSGGAVAGLFPWNLMAIISAQALSFPTAAYVKYAYYLWLVPVFTLAFIFCSRSQTPQRAQRESV